MEAGARFTNLNLVIVTDLLSANYLIFNSNLRFEIFLQRPIKGKKVKSAFGPSGPSGQSLSRFP